jgi:hypothetical protein
VRRGGLPAESTTGQPAGVTRDAAEFAHREIENRVREVVLSGPFDRRGDARGSSTTAALTSEPNARPLADVVENDEVGALAGELRLGVRHRLRARRGLGRERDEHLAGRLLAPSSAAMSGFSVSSITGAAPSSVFLIFWSA